MLLENVGFHIKTVEEMKFFESLQCFQIGLQNPNSLNFPHYWAKTKAESWIKDFPGKKIVCHAPYKTNIIAHTNTYHLSVENVKYHLMLCNKLGIEFLVVHPGVYDLKSENSIKHSKAVLKQTLEEIQKSVPESKTILLLENLPLFSALVLDDLAEVVNEVENTGLCLDTNHAFGQGYEDSDILKWAKRDVVKIVHLNGSQRGSLRGHFGDYHTNITLQSSVGLSTDFILGLAKEIPDKIKIVEQNFKYALKTWNFLKLQKGDQYNG